MGKFKMKILIVNPFFYLLIFIHFACTTNIRIANNNLLVEDQNKLKTELLDKKCEIKSNNKILYGKFVGVKENVINLAESDRTVKIPVDDIERITYSDKVRSTLAGAVIGVSIAWLVGLERLNKQNSDWGLTDPNIHSSVTNSELILGAAIGGSLGFFYSDKKYEFHEFTILDYRLINETKNVLIFDIDRKYVELEKDHIQKISLNSEEYHMVEKGYFEHELTKYETCMVDSAKQLTNGYILYVNHKHISASNSDINRVYKSDGKTYIVSKTDYCGKLTYLK